LKHGVNSHPFDHDVKYTDNAPSIITVHTDQLLTEAIISRDDTEICQEFRPVFR